MMRTEAQDAFGKVAVCTQHLIAGWVALCLEQLIQGRSHQSALAVFRAVVLDMVQLQELRDGLAAARTHWPTIGVERIHLQAHCLVPAAVNAVLALLVAVSAWASATTQPVGGMLVAQGAALLLAVVASLMAVLCWPPTRLAHSARYTLGVRGALTLDTARAIQFPGVAWTAAYQTETERPVTLAAVLFDSVSFRFGLA